MQIEIPKPVKVSKEDSEWIEIIDAEGEVVVSCMIEDEEYLDKDMATMQHIADAINAYKG